MGVWIYQGEEFLEAPEGFYGFVYCITNLESGKKYIGKKIFLGKNGRKSYWQSYYGSSDTLREDIKLLGKDKFKREILHLAKSKGELTYLETMEQFKSDVVRSDNYYNTNILGKFYRKTVVPPSN